MTDPVLWEWAGFAAGLLNIASNLPQLLAALAVRRTGPRELPQIAGRTIQLVANLIWFSYALHKGLPSLYWTSGVMLLCLVLLLVHLTWRGRR